MSATKTPDSRARGGRNPQTVSSPVHLARLSASRPAGSRELPRWVRRCVLAADRRRCVFCGSEQHLEVDHVIPVFFGGADRWGNLVTTCQVHNRIKGTYFTDAAGRVRYRGWPGQTDRALAAAILAAERRALRNPARWARLAVAIWRGRT